MLDNQRLSEMDRLIRRFQQYGSVNNIGKQKNFADKIRGLGSNIEGLDTNSLLNSLYAVPGSEGYYDPSQYAWGAYSGGSSGTGAPSGTSPNDVNIDTSLGDLANMPGYGDFATAPPYWLQGEDKSWKDIAQADMMSQWVEAQRRAAGQDRAANVAAQQMEQTQGLIDTPLISDADVERLLGRQAGVLAGNEAATQNAIRENMGGRGLSPSSGIGAAMSGKAALARNMGLGQAGNDLQTQQMLQNRSALERALGLQSSNASNLENILTGYGTQQWNLPAADYWQAIQNQQSAGGNAGAGALSGAMSGAAAGSALGPYGMIGGALIGGASGYLSSR